MAAAAANSAQIVPESRLICRVCQKQFSKYTCPQCNLKYCSLACYKDYSTRFKDAEQDLEISTRKSKKRSKSHSGGLASR